VFGNEIKRQKTKEKRKKNRMNFNEKFGNEAPKGNREKLFC